MEGIPLTLPNAITLARLLLVPVIVLALAQGAYGLALVGFLAAAISDAVDGILARLLDQRSRIGAILDAIADKLVIFSTLVMLTAAAWLPLWLAAFLVARDAFMVAAIWLYRQRAGTVEIAPLFLGKLHVFLVFGLLSLILAHAAGAADYSAWFPALTGLVVLSGAGSAVLYVVVWLRKLAPAAHRRPS